jgi:hypothetical protein
MEGDALAFALWGRMAKSEVAHGPQAAWQDVAKIAF